MRSMNTTPDISREEVWISVAHAARLIPSPRGTTHRNTIYRWIKAGKLRCRRRGPWRFVERGEVLALLTDEPAPPPPQPKPSKATDALYRARTEEILRKHGLRK